MQKFLFSLIFILLTIPAFGGNPNKCSELLLTELKSVLAKDKGLIQTQLNLTALKLAQKILKRKGLEAQSIEAYKSSILGNKTLKRLSSSESTQAEILNLYNKFGSTEYLDAKLDLEQLMNKSTQLSDKDISKMMIQLQSNWKDFDFNENDYAITWLTNKMSQSALGQDSYFISQSLKRILTDIEKPETFRAKEKLLSYNIKKNLEKIKIEFLKIKNNVFEKHKDICLNYYGDNKDAQNTSIYVHCGINEAKVMEDVFTQALTDILNQVEDQNFNLSINLEKPQEIELNSEQVRQIQDDINKADTSKERIIKYYQSPLLAEEDKCDGFVIVDKKNQTLEVYDKNGTEVFSTKSIIGDNTRTDGIEFHPDSILRSWKIYDANGDVMINEVTGNPLYKYSHTTGAGIFYTKKDLSQNQRQQRLYDDEFNDRVLVLSSREPNRETLKYSYPEKIQAIHGVPNMGWIPNRDSRLKAFDDSSIARRQSAGCVNLEGYTYDLMNEMLGHECPIYVLPEDDQNYFFVKNRELSFATSNTDFNANRQRALLPNGSPSEFTNNFAFSPVSIARHTSDYVITSGADSKVVKRLMKPSVRKELYQRARILENDQYEDFVAMAYGITNDPKKAKDVFLNLYNSYWRITQKDQTNLDFKSSTTKRNLILQRYKQDFDPNIDIDSILNASSSVVFIH